VRETRLPDPSGCNAHNPPRWPNVPGLNWRNTGFAQTGRSPAICVSWSEAAAYADWLSRRTGQRYRLLSESEWEYAARSGSQGQDFWGDDPAAACAYANGPDQTMLGRFPDQRAGLAPFILPCEDHFVFTSPVGSFKPSPWGLYDMMGNVFEWVQDCWWKNYDGAPVDGSPRLQGECRMRVNRGGSWTSIPTGVRAAHRGDDQYTTTRVLDLGFRIAREVDPTRAPGSAPARRGR
jgi:formylglycine-generating enzyme required for sulfatase activity